jgi:glutathione S-transferase
MKLLYAPTSPYVRKVMVVAIETGQEAEVETVFAGANPMVPNAELNAVNPLAKIPALVFDDGAIFDSRVICEYLAARVSDHGIFPDPGPARWRALTDQAIADGLLDAAIAARYERLMRPPEFQFSGWTDAQLAKIDRALDAMAARIPAAADIGAIAFGCALGYLDFRYAELDWRTTRPALGEWYAGFAERPSMRLTVPKDI